MFFILLTFNLKKDFNEKFESLQKLLSKPTLRRYEDVQDNLRKINDIRFRQIPPQMQYYVANKRNSFAADIKVTLTNILKEKLVIFEQTKALIS